MYGFRRKNIWIIIGASGLNFLFFMILISMNRTPELIEAQEKLNVISVSQVQPKNAKTPSRKTSRKKLTKKTTKKKLKLKTVSLNQNNMKPRKTKRILNIDIQPSLNIAEADVVIQADYSAAANTEAERILELNEVDEPPWKINHIQPVYPYLARVQKIEGEVTLRFLVNKKGRVSDVQILKVHGFSGFGSSARKAVLRWRFKPATYFGRPAVVRCVQKISFNLEGL